MQSSKTTTMKSTGANPEAMKVDLERRRSNAGRPHDPRPHRQRSRASSKAAAIREAS